VLYFYSFASIGDSCYCLSLDFLDWKHLHPEYLASCSHLYIAYLLACIFTSIIFTYMPFMWYDGWLVGDVGGGSGLAVRLPCEIVVGWRDGSVESHVGGGVKEFWRYSLSWHFSSVILAGVRGFTLEWCTKCMECLRSGSCGYDGYVTGVVVVATCERWATWLVEGACSGQLRTVVGWCLGHGTMLNVHTTGPVWGGAHSIELVWTNLVMWEKRCTGFCPRSTVRRMSMVFPATVGGP
jgi:hypothetical protein